MHPRGIIPRSTGNTVDDLSLSHMHRPKWTVRRHPFVDCIMEADIPLGWCHTLILFGDNCLSTYRFLLVTLTCLEPIVARSVRFCDVSQGNKPKAQNRAELINLGGVLQPWAHLSPSGSFYMKQPARLGKHVTSSLSHQLAWASWAASSSPIFAINRRGRL